jgi:hypothetical protein
LNKGYGVLDVSNALSQVEVVDNLLDLLEELCQLLAFERTRLERLDQLLKLVVERKSVVNLVRWVCGGGG